jgi:mRNA-degrading endonuclease toxin of MazEF toxin-antitoxin module
MINQTRAVDKIRLIKKLGQLPAGLMEEANQALKLHYDLD